MASRHLFDALLLNLQRLGNHLGLYVIRHEQATAQDSSKAPVWNIPETPKAK